MYFISFIHIDLYMFKQSMKKNTFFYITKLTEMYAFANLSALFSLELTTLLDLLFPFSIPTLEVILGIGVII